MRKLFSLLIALAISAYIVLPALAAEPLRVLSYNVEDGFNHGDPAHLDTFVTWVNQQKPDIAFFQEMNDFTPVKLSLFAKRFGHEYSVLSKTTGYPVAITSRFPIDVIKIQNAPMTHSFIHARIKDYDVLVLHLNPHIQTKRAEEIQLVLAEVAKIPAGRKIILAGDFNSMNSHDGAHMSEAEVEGLRKKEEQNPLLHNLVNGQPDFSITAKVEAAGLVDAYRLDRGSDSPAFAKNHPLIGHRIDYIWVSANLADKVLSCSFVYDDITAHLSDHHPLFMTLAQ